MIERVEPEAACRRGAICRRTDAGRFADSLNQFDLNRELALDTIEV